MPILMNLAIEPTPHMFEVSTHLQTNPTRPAEQGVRRVLRVLADTPKGAVQIVRSRYPQSRQHKVEACHLWAGQHFSA